jgi:hypothetical protein
MATSRKAFEIRAGWDGEAGVWWCSNDELPLTTEAPTFDQLVARVLEIAPGSRPKTAWRLRETRSSCTLLPSGVQAVPVVAARVFSCSATARPGSVDRRGRPVTIMSKGWPAGIHNLEDCGFGGADAIE